MRSRGQMRAPSRRVLVAVMLVMLAAHGVCLLAQSPRSDSFPSWNDGRTKRAILDFVARTTTPGSATARKKVLPFEQ